ncbi:nucleotidyltransferase domain-containing protein [Geotalea sp. SG265]|uniref:nucleotidyltransferase family protein n=1 Tax=Geotalea sp. SG265 TaxID=2922867 RepID=UPI001FAF649A|nr:nucleotidyltransferase domain-containing protein [Geotalea sp. SG265]
MSGTFVKADLDLKPHDWDEVRRILEKSLPGYEVWAFGSRAKWTAKPYSDLDLAVISDRPLPIDLMADLRQSFEDSDLTIKVDVVDWATTSPAFRKIIEESKVVVKQGVTRLDAKKP